MDRPIPGLHLVGWPGRRGATGAVALVEDEVARLWRCVVTLVEYLGCSWVSPGSGFPPEVIMVVRWYLRYRLPYRDVEEPLAERSIEVDHVTSTGGCSGSRHC